MFSVCDVYSAVLKCIASILNKKVIALSVNNLFKTFAYIESHNIVATWTVIHKIMKKTIVIANGC